MPSPKCQQCGKPLENTESINRGMGPDCLEKRAKYLAVGGASEADLREWAVSEDATLARWARKIVAACADENQKCVSLFVQAAKRRAEELMPLEKAA